MMFAELRERYGREAIRDISFGAKYRNTLALFDPGIMRYGENVMSEEKNLNPDTVEIIMATYNGEQYVCEQLDSLLNQTYTELKVVVCDDGSGDGTKELVRGYERTDHRVELHENNKNLGYVKNFLEGVKRSTEPYIMLCDQDDIWNTDKVEVTLRAMREEEKKYPQKPILVFTDAVNFDSRTKKMLGSFHESSRLNTKRVDTAHLFMENKIIGCTVMINAAVVPYLEKLPKEIRVHDWWLGLICSHFGRIVYVEQPTLLYRQHSGNMIGGSRYGDYVKNRLSSFERQREALLASYRQGRAFLDVFGDKMSEEQRQTARIFADLERTGWIKKRYQMAKYGFTKSGLVRNIGLFFLA